MNIPILIVEVITCSRAKSVSSAFRNIGITELPVNHGDMFARWCKKWNRWNLAWYFSNIWVRYRRGPSSGHCSGHWTSRVQFYLTVPSAWGKASPAVCWSPPGKPMSCYWVLVDFVCVFSSFYFLFIFLSFLYLPFLFPFRFAQIPSVMA